MLRIEGKRVDLRDYRLDDLPVYRYWHQPGHRWQDLDGPYYGRPSPTMVEREIQRLREHIEDFEWNEPRFGLNIADRQDDAMIGRVSRYWISEETHWLATGITIFDPDHWRQGIGYEAFGLWCDYLLREMPELVRLDLRTWSGNHGMMKLAEKLGFQQEACFRMARIVDGDYYDGLGYGILRTEWESRYPDGFAAHLPD